MKQIPMLDLRREYEYMKEEIDSAIKRCLYHQKWILGPEVGELERKIAEYIGVKHCVCISYCNRRCDIKGRRLQVIPYPSRGGIGWGWDKLAERI